jgi:beta-glucuronidase
VYQAQTLEKQIKGALNQKGCSEVYIWQLFDIRVSDEWFGVRPRTRTTREFWTNTEDASYRTML